MDEHLGQGRSWLLPSGMPEQLCGVPVEMRDSDSGNRNPEHRARHESSWLDTLVRPRSFGMLILFGFGLAALPLFIALTITSWQVERLARHGQDAVRDAVAATQGGRSLIEQITAVERSLRQYLVLKDQALFQTYLETRGEFRDTARKMMNLERDAGQYRRLQDLIAAERAVANQVGNPPGEPAVLRAAVNRFGALKESSRALLGEGQRLLSVRVTEMNDMAERAEDLLRWQAIGLVLAALILSVVSSALILRPVRQIERAITRLGSSDFTTPVQVRGPRDLESLGRHMEWLRHRLATLEAQKQSFLRHISHELKTPLTAVREGSTLLAEGTLGPLNNQQTEVTGILQANAMRLQRQIEDLLAFSRLREAGGSQGVWERVSVDRLIGEVLNDYRLPALRRQLRFDTRLTALSMHGDRGKIRTVVDNLISNAVKYSPVGDRVEISLASVDGRIQFEVWDGGPGISKGESMRIFDPFYQGSIQPEGPVRGTGLGLTIAQECARSQGGEISVIFDGNPGTRIRASFPDLSAEGSS